MAHFNNKNANGLYDYFVSLLRIIYDLHYSGKDGEYLMKCIQELEIGNVLSAYEMFSKPIVQKNRTSLGGRNNLGDLLSYQFKKISSIKQDL
jgi:hypothetical protein